LYGDQDHLLDVITPALGSTPEEVDANSDKLKTYVPILI
jgi:hypothetical protein